MTTVGGCVEMGGAIVCIPGAFLRRRVVHCPTCGRRRRFIQRIYRWYEDVSTCLGCGDSWEEQYRQARPFRRGWRAEATEEAKRLWAAAEPYDRAALYRWLCGEDA